MSDQPRSTPRKTNDAPLRFFTALYHEKRDMYYFETPTGRSRWYAKQGACKTDAFLAEAECKRRGWVLERESDARAERIAELEKEAARLHNHWHAAEERANKLRDDFNVVSEESCQLQDALGCPCELPDAQTKAMERIRDLIAAEGELGDTRSENAKLREALGNIVTHAGNFSECVISLSKCGQIAREALAGKDMSNPTA